MPPKSPPALPALLASLSALLRALGCAWLTAESTADARPAWPAPASPTPRSVCQPTRPRARPAQLTQPAPLATGPPSSDHTRSDWAERAAQRRTAPAQHFEPPCSVQRHRTARWVGVPTGVRRRSERRRRAQTTPASIGGTVAELLAASCTFQAAGGELR